MKELLKEEMNHVSGAGDIDWNSAIDYKNYNNFGDYINFMLKHNMKPLGVVDSATRLPERGLMPAYASWCKSIGVSPEEYSKKLG